MFKKEITYGYGDVCIIDAITSDIEHRSCCNTKKNGMLPIFTAPMSSVLNEKNYKVFKDNGIIPIIPRTVNIEKRNELVKDGVWVSYSLNEFKIFVSENESVNPETKICIDLAKGNLTTIFEIAKQAKEKYGNNIILMTGNISNPETYKEYCRAGIDYVRLAIGSGAGCFDDGTMITMYDGTKKKIEDVLVGESVLTMNGNPGIVSSRIRYKSKEKKLKINNEIIATENHKFFVINKSDTEKINDRNIMDFGYWIEANKLDKNNHLLVKFKK